MFIHQNVIQTASSDPRMFNDMEMDASYKGTLENSFIAESINVCCLSNGKFKKVCLGSVNSSVCLLTKRIAPIL